MLPYCGKPVKKAGFLTGPTTYPTAWRSPPRTRTYMTRRAFTLIELLVVIAIIAILAAILFPVFAQAKLAAKATVSISNINQLATAVQLYVNDYDDTVPLSGAWNTGNDVVAMPSADTVSTWSWLLMPYMKTSGVALDPLAPSNGQVLTNASSTATDLFFPQYGYNY